MVQIVFSLGAAMTWELINRIESQQYRVYTCTLRKKLSIIFWNQPKDDKKPPEIGNNKNEQKKKRTESIDQSSAEQNYAERFSIAYIPHQVVISAIRRARAPFPPSTRKKGFVGGGGGGGYTLERGRQPQHIQLSSRIVSLFLSLFLYSQREWKEGGSATPISLYTNTSTYAHTLTHTPLHSQQPIFIDHHRRHRPSVLAFHYPRQ